MKIINTITQISINILQLVKHTGLIPTSKLLIVQLASNPVVITLSVI